METLPTRPVTALNRIDTRLLCSHVSEELMVTIAVELMSSLVAHVVRVAVAACCGRPLGVLSTPPFPKTEWASHF